jgi:hypothetical protein
MITSDGTSWVVKIGMSAGEVEVKIVKITTKTPIIVAMVHFIGRSNQTVPENSGDDRNLDAG